MRRLPRYSGARRDRLQLQRPQRQSGEVNDRERKVLRARKTCLRLALLHGQMWSLRAHDQSDT
jgi:hypothetical protein